MPPPKRQVEPRTFFLNETHELSPKERGGGGRVPQYTGILWAAKAKHISGSLDAVEKEVRASNDPLKDDRYFVMAQPVPKTRKVTAAKKYPEGVREEKTEFGGAHGKVFDRLGLDLLHVTETGDAVVHAGKETFNQLQQRSASLEKLGVREQSRWATIDSFGTIPLELRVDADWLRSLEQHEPSDVVIELQPVLTRVEADRVLRVIADLLTQREGEKLTGTGTDFSGRHWFRGKATRQSVRKVARDFFSVQAVHSPLYSIAAAKPKGKARPIQLRESTPPPDADSLPCVAVVDLGVPADHKQLAAYKRGQFVPPNAPRPPMGDHGSFVASRVVFGECATAEELTGSVGQCSFYDAMAGEFDFGENRRIDDKVVMTVLSGVRGAAPDVRVFNLSFGSTKPLHAFDEVEKAQQLALLRDLDNFVFVNDSVVVVAAGNSHPGVVPNPGYPDHHADGRWALGPWACGFNTLVCGSLVPTLSTNGLVQTVGWPSPFTRIGPGGLCDAPVPSFSAGGGNWDDTFNFRPGLGVWGFSGRGLPEDQSGTSLAAPLLAREAALTLHELQQRHCQPGTQPFAVTARAFMTITADRPTRDKTVRILVERTLGHGKGSTDRLVTPAPGSALILWQGFIESVKDTARVQLPIPRPWLSRAKEPILRLVVCWDSPVNEVAHATWACRKIRAVLHLGPDATWARAPSGGHPSFPVIDRRYKLSPYRPGQPRSAEGDMWLIELAYEEKAPYPPWMDFDPRQRVAFAAELVDEGESPIDPQPAMQALPIAASMNRLSIQPVPIRSPVIIRTRM